MRCSAEIDYAPAYELVLSLFVFLERSKWKTLDLGPAWGAEVERRLGPDLKARIRSQKAPRTLPLLFLLIHEAPGDRSPESFLDWLASLSPGDLYERLVCRVEAEHREPLGDLGAWRDGVLAILRVWHEHYFRGLDPAILAHLQKDAAARRAQAAVTPALELVAEATNGLHLEEEHAKIVLVPQYHMSPWNVGTGLKDLRVILYPVEPLQTNPDDPPLALTRLTRALADENRLRILRFLAREPMSLNELTDHTGLAKSTVHHHMVALRAAGLVFIHEKGADGRYYLRPGWLDLLAGRLSAYVAPE